MRARAARGEGARGRWPAVRAADVGSGCVLLAPGRWGRYCTSWLKSPQKLDTNTTRGHTCWPNCWRPLTRDKSSKRWRPHWATYLFSMFCGAKSRPCDAANHVIRQISKTIYLPLTIKNSSFFLFVSLLHFDLRTLFEIEELILISPSKVRPPCKTHSRRNKYQVWTFAINYEKVFWIHDCWIHNSQEMSLNCCISFSHEKYNI